MGIAASESESFLVAIDFVTPAKQRSAASSISPLWLTG
jgi:hypothetical protein